MPVFPNVRSWSANARYNLFVVICFSTIGLVSAFDTWAAVANSEILLEEKNPVCLKLLELDPEGKTYFVVAKATGTLVTMSVLCMLLKFGYRHAMFVTTSVAAFQLGLMIYLCFSDPRCYGLPNFFFYCNSPESIFHLS